MVICIWNETNIVLLLLLLLTFSESAWSQEPSAWHGQLEAEEGGEGLGGDRELGAELLCGSIHTGQDIVFTNECDSSEER